MGRDQAPRLDIPTKSRRESPELAQPPGRENVDHACVGEMLCTQFQYFAFDLSDLVAGFTICTFDYDHTESDLCEHEPTYNCSEYLRTTHSDFQG